MEEYTNELIKESSPYLLQHAHNPVNWVPWSRDIFKQAKKEGKLVLISVGYSSCHWCHVMAHESFEDEEVAALMNKLFINVKVDREERPDVDNVYMSAVQLMTQRGGWPLNCFTLPDGRPVYGGTYYPKEQWMHLLKSLHHTYTEDPERMEEYAEKLREGIRSSELIKVPESLSGFERNKLDEMLQRWSSGFDWNYGGGTRAPKFPLPNNYEFLLELAIRSSDERLLNYIELSLNKMAMGGIYDQIGGGFSRYSVDMLWKVPHFEKMLYDNAQLIDLYSTAYRTYGHAHYKQVVYDTVDWLNREMKSDTQAFFSAMDADSEGEEGKFYIWTESELESILGKDFSWVKSYYSIGKMGHWEDGKQILLQSQPQEDAAHSFGWSLPELNDNVQRINKLLLDKRNERVRPGIDTKCLTAWNAMLVKGLCNAAITFDDKVMREMAVQIADWIIGKQTKENGSLWRVETNGKSTINGFLDDYANVITACIALYELTFEESWLHRAKRFTNYVTDHFFDPNSGMFFYTSQDTELLVRKMELNDNVIPASNSVMARNLFSLSQYFQNEEYKKMAEQMLANVYDGMEMHGSGYSNWGQLLIHLVYHRSECVVVGAEIEKMRALQQAKLPNTLFAYASKSSDLPLFSDKPLADTTTIYVCEHGLCNAPTSDVTEAKEYIMK